MLAQRRKDPLERCLALALAGLMLFGIANIYPFLTFQMEFEVRHTTLLTGILELFRQGYPGVGAMVFLSIVLAPAVQLVGTLVLLVPIKFGRFPRWIPRIMGLVRLSRPWSMMEIFMLGILVALVKLLKMARIEPGIAIVSFFVLICVMAALTAAFDTHWIWEQWALRRPKQN